MNALTWVNEAIEGMERRPYEFDGRATVLEYLTVIKKKLEAENRHPLLLSEDGTLDLMASLKEAAKEAIRQRDQVWIRHAEAIKLEGIERFENPMLALASRVALEDLK
jgi:hypothetical protein